MTSAAHRWMVGHRPDPHLHVLRRDTPWRAPSECHGGMGGFSDGGYRAECGAWGVPVYTDEELRGRAICDTCRPVFEMDRALAGEYYALSAAS